MCARSAGRRFGRCARRHNVVALLTFTYAELPLRSHPRLCAAQFYSVFDRVNNRVGLAPAVHTSKVNILKPQATSSQAELTKGASGAEVAPGQQ